MVPSQKSRLGNWTIKREAQVRRAVHHRDRYIITEKSLREFQIGGSVFRAVVRLNVSRIAPRTFRVDAHTTFINERIFRLPFWPPVFLSLIRHLISSNPIAVTPRPSSPRQGFAWNACRRCRRSRRRWGENTGNAKRSRFPGVLLKRSDIDFRSEGISMSRNNAFPERATPRRSPPPAGPRPDADFRVTFDFPSTREPPLEANSSAIFNARLNVTTAPEKWSVDVDTRLSSFLFVGCRGRTGRFIEFPKVSEKVQ